jgi:hypothetical protein
MASMVKAEETTVIKRDHGDSDTTMIKERKGHGDRTVIEKPGGPECLMTNSTLGRMTNSTSGETFKPTSLPPLPKVHPW